MVQIKTVKASKPRLTTFARFLDWLGAARRENEDISSDALRIASLEAANKSLATKLQQTKVAAMVWQVKAEDLQVKLDTLQTKWAGAQETIAYALKCKASLAAYELKRGAK